MTDDNVIHLAFRSPLSDTSSTETLACGTCKNKAWTAIYEAAGNGFPRLKCTNCGMSAGLFGWVGETVQEGGGRESP